jgi:hypothetical protein
MIAFCPIRETVMQIEATHPADAARRALRQHGRQPLVASARSAGRPGSRNRLIRAGRRNSIRLDVLQPLAYETA